MTKARASGETRAKEEGEAMSEKQSPPLILEQTVGDYAARP